MWYKFTAPYNALVNINVTIEDPAQFDSALSAWDGCGGTEIGCNELYGDEHLYSVFVPAGQTIYIRVAGYEGIFPDEGEFTVSVTPAIQ